MKEYEQYRSSLKGIRMQVSCRRSKTNPGIIHCSKILQKENRWHWRSPLDERSLTNSRHAQRDEQANGSTEYTQQKCHTFAALYTAPKNRASYYFDDQMHQHYCLPSNLWPFELESFQRELKPTVSRYSAWRFWLWIHCISDWHSVIVLTFQLLVREHMHPTHGSREPLSWIA